DAVAAEGSAVVRVSVRLGLEYLAGKGRLPGARAAEARDLALNGVLPADPLRARARNAEHVRRLDVHALQLGDAACQVLVDAADPGLRLCIAVRMCACRAG